MGLSLRLYGPVDRCDVDLERLCDVPHGFLASTRRRNNCACSGLSFRRRPNCTPLFLAASLPAPVRSRIKSRWNSSIPAQDGHDHLASMRCRVCPRF